MISSARSGCHWCSLLLANLRNEGLLAESIIDNDHDAELEDVPSRLSVQILEIGTPNVEIRCNGYRSFFFSDDIRRLSY